ncbi:MAG: CpsD/CapB family tyrosine-protein kinase [Candidatus Binatia bacterium]
MSRTYDALKRAESLRAGKGAGSQLDSSPAVGGGYLGSPDEYYELRRSMSAISIGNEVKTVMVAASLHGEGASSVAYLLARALSEEGRSKVLLVDMNMRTPALWRMTQVADYTGLMNVAAGEKAVEEVIQPTSVQGLSVITAGSGGMKPIDVVEYVRTSEAGSALTSLADVVFLDAPPVALYPDALAIAPMVDGVVMVVEADATPVSVAARTVELVKSGGSEVLGVVLNKRHDYIPARIAELIA